MMGDGTMMDGGWWIAMWVFMAVFWVLVIGGLVALVSWLATGRRTDSADDVLDRRFAAGQIDETEYRALRDALHGGPPGRAAAH